jgi:hypothetical protein
MRGNSLTDPSFLAAIPPFSLSYPSWSSSCDSADIRSGMIDCHDGDRGVEAVFEIEVRQARKVRP